MSGSIGAFMGPLAQVLGIIEGAAGGGLPALLAQLESAGLSETVRSWVGHGENVPVTAEELGRALPTDQVEVWAREAGTSPEALLAHLSEHLPGAVHRASPNGRMPG